MCTVSVEVNEKVLRGVNPNLDSSAALRQWVQQLVNYHTQMMVDDNDDMTRTCPLSCPLSCTLKEENN